MSDHLIPYLRALAAGRHDDVSVAVDAVIEIKRLTCERDEARAAVKKLRAVLQEVTLAAHGCAQCRDEIGRICRNALEAKP